MNKKTDDLNLLFHNWEQSNPDYVGKFVRDGIIDENKYIDVSSKILFITKEPNKPKQIAGDYRQWWKQELIYTFSRRMAEWSYGILENFPPFDQLKYDELAKIDAIQKIAFMNVKKIGGGNLSEYDGVIEHIKQDYDFIRKEIEIIDPDIIILGLTWKALRAELFPEIKNNWSDSGYDIHISRLNDAKVIDFYHPSSRNAPAATYSLLQNIINYSAFQSL